MAQFEKRIGAPTGDLNIALMGTNYLFTDGGTVSENNYARVIALQNHPYVQRVGGDLSVPVVDEFVDVLVKLDAPEFSVPVKGTDDRMWNFVDVSTLAGADGTPGTPGADGHVGTDGKTVRSGAGAPAAGLGVDGDFYINTTTDDIYGPKTSGAWGAATSLIGRLPSRFDAVYTTGSLAAGARETGVITLGKSFRLLRIDTSRPARVRLYTTTAKRDADATRAQGTVPSYAIDHGLLFEAITYGGVVGPPSIPALLGFDLFPEVFGASLAATPSANIAITVDNLDSATGTVAVTFKNQTWE